VVIELTEVPSVRGIESSTRKMHYGTLAYLSAVRASVDSAAKELLGKIKKNASAVCHNVRDFNRWLPAFKSKWSPYARRWHGAPPSHPHPDKPWLVHRFSGQLAESIKYSYTPQPGVMNITFYPDESIAPHARYVIKGTDKMVPRDFIRGTIEENPQLMKKFGTLTVRPESFGFGLVPSLYLIARISKYLGDFIGISTFTSNMYSLARSARDLEIALLHPTVGLSTRLYNRTVGGRIAARFLVPAKGTAATLVNAQITRAFTSKVAFLQMPRIRRR